MKTLQELVDRGITRGLIIRSPHIEKILNGSKTWEMRSTRCHSRGPIALIRGGSGLIVGTAYLQGSGIALTQKRAERLRGFHQVEDLEKLKKWKYPWILHEAKPLVEPIKYNHPKGCVIWVDLTKLVNR